MSSVKGTWSDTEFTKTYEWTVDWTGEGQTKEEWNLGGLGVEGDSVEDNNYVRGNCGAAL
jgi:hypothetical protein